MTMLAAVVDFLLCCALLVLGGVGCSVAAEASTRDGAVWCVLIAAVIIADLVLIIIASLHASRGEFYRYPFTIRFIK